MIVVDLDETLVELARPVARLLGRHYVAASADYPRQYDWAKELGMPNDALWKRVEEEGPEFWATLPWTLWGERLLDSLRRTGQDIILFSRVVGPNSAAGKNVWARNNVPRGIPLFTTDSIKHPLAAPGRYLIDDSPENCEAWEAHRGTAIMVPQPYNANRSFVGDEYNYIMKELWFLDLVSENDA